MHAAIPHPRTPLHKVVYKSDYGWAGDIWVEYALCVQMCYFNLGHVWVTTYTAEKSLTPKKYLVQGKKLCSPTIEKNPWSLKNIYDIASLSPLKVKLRAIKFTLMEVFIFAMLATTALLHDNWTTPGVKCSVSKSQHRFCCLFNGLPAERRFYRKKHIGMALIECGDTILFVRLSIMIFLKSIMLRRKFHIRARK